MITTSATESRDAALEREEGLVIRPMRVDDLDQVLEIERKSFRNAWVRDAFLNEIHFENVACPLVAEIGGEVVGYITAWFVEDEIHITNIAVSPHHRRKGIGTVLLRAILDKGRREGYRLAYLEVRPSNESAIRLYRKWGFRVVSVRPRYYESDGEDALVMAKSLWESE
jgi:ribosomal-protein-alanine N-acetyltransferase